MASLKEAKQAVDEGYWPLYRWNPSNPSTPFHLDSETLKGQLESFLERDSHLSLISNTDTLQTLSLAGGVGPSVESELAHLMEHKIRNTYNDLVASLNRVPVLILYGSDGGVAASAAKRLGLEAKQRGLKPKVAVMNDYTVEDLATHKNIVFVVSTAGQGEFPGNARELWKGLQTAQRETSGLVGVRYAVFALGDSHYWPLPEDAHYFCKSGKDLDVQLETLGATRLVPVGLGNDRDSDGWQTGYRLFTLVSLSPSFF